MPALVQMGILSFGDLLDESLKQETLTVVDAIPDRILTASSARQRSFYGGRTALRRLLKQAGVSKDVRITANPQFGYLQIPSRPNAHINLSHTENISVAVLASSPVGVDIESLSRPMKPSVFERVTTEDERETCRALDPAWASQPIVWWSAKEAVSKACGLGIKFGMREFGLKPMGGKVWDVKCRIPSPFALRDPIVEQIEWNGYVISVCGERESFPCEWRVF